MQYWLAHLALSVVACIATFVLIAGLLGGLSHLNLVEVATALNRKDLSIMGPVWALSLVFAYPSLAVTTKRWHDRGKSGWWWLINLVPIIGPLWMLIELGFLGGEEGENRFGPDPAYA